MNADVGMYDTPNKVVNNDAICVPLDLDQFRQSFVEDQRKTKISVANYWTWTNTYCRDHTYMRKDLDKEMRRLTGLYGGSQNDQGEEEDINSYNLRRRSKEIKPRHCKPNSSLVLPEQFFRKFFLDPPYYSEERSAVRKRREQSGSTIQQLTPRKQYKNYVTMMERTFNHDDSPVELMHGTLEKALETFKTTSCQGKKVLDAISKIPQPERIKKIVCIGLGILRNPLVHRSTLNSVFLDEGERRNGKKKMDLFYKNYDRTRTELATDRSTAPMVRFNGQPVAQHTAARAIAEKIQQMTGQDIELYAADPTYGARTKQVLETLPGARFKLLDPRYGYQEQFAEIDDTTLVINFNATSNVWDIVFHYCRPAALICESAYRDRPSHDDDDPPPHRNIYWYEVDNRWFPGQFPKTIAIPGSNNTGTSYSARCNDIVETEYELTDEFTIPDSECPQRHDLIDNASSESRGLYWHDSIRLYTRKV
ncbi:putative SRR1-like domain-containing protein [Seiridium cardinale]|uniref:SRR1-like domain-containing protein n=1 Tax=Seiridium cardinale TaxID=138064 RepID=A0ABR2XK08_9PEZI